VIVSYALRALRWPESTTKAKVAAQAPGCQTILRVVRFRIGHGPGGADASAMATILFAEDEERMRRLLGMMLGNKGHKLVACADGEELLSKLGETVPDLILTDLRLPKVDGLAVIEGVRAQLPEVPISC